MATEEEIREMIKENLVKYRKANNLTGEDVSEALNMNHGTYRSWETGRSSPKFSSVIKLSQIYGVTVDNLLYDHDMLNNSPYSRLESPRGSSYNSDIYGDDYLSQLSNWEKVVIMKIRQLNQEDKDKVVELLKELNK